MKIRKAVRQDVPLILEFIKGIARYEKMENEVVATTELLEEQLFDKGRAEVIFAMEEGVEVGFALFFHNFSTFLGRSGLYLEDLFVYPEHRGKGYGKALFLELVRIANERGCGRMEWVCLNWNKPSIDFYRSMGAVPLDEWTTYRLTSDAMKKLTSL
jgi:GNAT superfamily N-acetyltransferase